MAGNSSMARSAQILRFVLKHRASGVFADPGSDTVVVAEVVESPQEADDLGPVAFVRDLEALGPTFIKLGQSLSTRTDMVPPAYLAALERMQDDVLPVPAAEIREIVEAELGVRLGKLFKEFEDVPLGSASLAQVHRAVLNDGREVAVKVQRPGVDNEAMIDLDTLAGLARRADSATGIGRRVRFSEWVQEFRKSLMAELDYRLEADNLERFGERLADYPELQVPAPLRDLCARRVLTMELVRGTKVTSLGGLRRTENDYELLASALMRGYLDQVFVHGEIHADPHPGNMLVTEEGRLAIFDLGMVAHVPPRQREHLLKLLLASVDGRGEEVAGETIAMSIQLEDFDEVRYVREVSHLVARYAAHAGSQALSEGRLMLELARLGLTCGLRSPPEMQMLGKTLLNLEGVSRALEPGLDVKRVVDGHLQSLMRQRMRQAFSPSRLAGDAMELQALLQEAPRKLSTILSLVSENKLRVNIGGLQESRLTENLQKIANRVAAGVIVAALIMASAMLMRGDVVGPKLFGYPAVAMVMFLLASALGFGIVLSVLVSDRRPKVREERSPRA
ncbi:AarF/UbiB family protein [Luteimonas sp. MC1895]|uniref:ABC1 kinase family protein n=1 Tax=Luteimonas sp. MC1895 TaxID=2819513 RepID=UPI0018F0C167|nr:AarF/UbiB family protein [Luteimonas sp. MC1895]MBJ6978790.1 AarF/ABC1/UbiB kinase family protein [Luteimonas sp. MC1895]